MEAIITPIILTCESDLAVTQEFTRSFATVRHALRPPVVLIDQSKSPRLSARYLSLVAAMEPGAVYVHPAEPGVSAYDSVQIAANIALEWGLHHSANGQYVMFKEDDIFFSAHFAKTVATIRMRPETGFVALYRPGDGYGRAVIDPNHFYGTCDSRLHGHGRSHSSNRFLP